MSLLPINFPTEQERLCRLIAADEEKSFEERIRAVDGLLSTIARLNGSNQPSGRRSRRDVREAEFKEMWRELAQHGRLRPSR